MNSLAVRNALAGVGSAVETFVGLSITGSPVLVIVLDFIY